MGNDSLIRHADGSLIVPANELDWEEWVSASSIHNFLLNDPLVDWLDRYGAARGFVRDDHLAGYDPRSDMATFIFRKGAEFEAAVVAHLRTLTSMETVAAGPEHVRDLAKAQRTFELMIEGVPIIHQGVLRHAQTRTYGAPDLIVRSDILAHLFPGAIDPAEGRIPAPDLRGPWHYRIVDIKFSTLHLKVGRSLGNGGSSPAYKGQIYVYTRALGALQGYLPPLAYGLGRGWEQTIKGETLRGSNM